MKTIKSILANALPLVLMIGAIPFFENDVVTSFVFLLIIAVSLFIRYEKGDTNLFIFGFVVLSFFEYMFVATGIETFTRQTYLGVMPLWLPILWGYAFIAIRRGIVALT